MMKLRNLIMAAVTACLGFASAAQADEMDDILKRGELRVAVQTQGAPVSFVDKKGERTGLAVELAKMMAADLGVKVTFQDYDWKGLIPALLSGKVDMIAADMTPTPQRAAQLLFSRPMFYQETVAVVAKDAPYKTWQEINKDGLNIGATQASSYGDAVKKFMPKANLKEFAGGTAAVAQALSSGRLDGAVSDLGNVTNFVREFGNLKILEGVITREPLAFATQANAFHLKLWLDNYVELITADRRLENLVNYWWNTSDWEKDHK
ncbi:ABC transporter substrate-binding protein [Microvirga sp. 17 mud 1-3]|uniref:ABC transporter substrate-binding protein n=1 Tax=Microvirga sp. 17 mud 1-3 TaxID=2082949 RepID=UPI000D6BC1C3|nr:ABC transporter substrate-binding protein [Microvirga sp. 17 mud 1-3]AWM86027.1 amino acid ABC transporter substrate-binding protein [Microvirga sp. 17 mud 1-3]